jgi:hypothetical protein
MRNMSRIRNTLRFQTPEERVLNGLLALVVIVLITVAVAMVNDERVEAAPQVKGVTITRGTLPATRGRAATTTTSIAPTTTTTISPAELFAFALAVQRNAEDSRRSTRTTTTAAPTPPPRIPTPPTTPTTAPIRTTSTSTSSTTSTTTTTSTPKLQGG